MKRSAKKKKTTEEISASDERWLSKGEGRDE